MSMLVRGIGTECNFSAFGVSERESSQFLLRMLHHSLQFAPQKKYNALQRDRCSFFKKKKKKERKKLSCMTRVKNKTSNEL